MHIGWSASVDKKPGSLEASPWNRIWLMAQCDANASFHNNVTIISVSSLKLLNNPPEFSHRRNKRKSKNTSYLSIITSRRQSALYTLHSSDQYIPRRDIKSFPEIDVLSTFSLLLTRPISLTPCVIVSRYHLQSFPIRQFRCWNHWP